MSDTSSASSSAGAGAPAAKSDEVKRSIRYVAKDAGREGASISKMRLPFGEAVGEITPFFDIRIMDGRRVSEKYTDLLPSEIRKILGTHTGDSVMVEALAKLETSNDPQVEGRVSIEKDNELRMAIGGSEANEQVLPPAALRAFVRKGNEFYYAGTPDRLAFVDSGTTLRTRENSAAVAAALVSISVARGWESITLAGSEDFRRLVWMEASRQGLEVLGYSPTPDDAMKAGLKHKPGKAEAPQIETEHFAAPSTSQAGANAEAGKSRDAAADRFTGQLLEHGPANYKFDPKERMNYFARLETSQGPVEHWGLGVEAAIKKTGAQLGDTIHLQKIGARPVEVPVNVRDEAGQVVGQQWGDAQRNDWSATVLAASKARPTAAGLEPGSPAQTVEAETPASRRAQAAAGIRAGDPKVQELFPELAGNAVAVVNTVQQTAQRDLQGKQPTAVEKVVQATRRILADQVEQGVSINLDVGQTNDKQQRRQDRAARR